MLLPDLDAESTAFLAGCSLATAKMMILMSMYRKRPKVAEQIGTVSGLFVYPVKGTHRLEVNEVTATNEGIYSEEVGMFDRHFMVIDEKRIFIKMSNLPALTLIHPSVHGDMLHLDSEGMPTLKVPKAPALDRSKVMPCSCHREDIEGQDCGDEAAQWLEKVTKKPGVRLAYAAPGLERRDIVAIGKTKWHQEAKPQDRAVYQDFGHALIISEESLNCLNSRLDKPVDMRPFRPNITIKGCSKPFEEDEIDALFIGGAKLRANKLCDRCPMVNIDPDTSGKHPSSTPVLDELKKYRVFPEMVPIKPMFGVIFFTDLTGPIRVGDPVYALKK